MEASGSCCRGSTEFRWAARYRVGAAAVSSNGVQRLRRRTGSPASTKVHRGEREIIARN